MQLDALEKSDPELAKLTRAEEQRQRDGLELIASENYVSRAVLEAMGTVFTNKYSEGYPGKRYYGGQENTDPMESIAIERAKKLFGSDHANVQPLSGAPANVAVYFAWLKPGDTVMGMDLGHGGHLTHGAPATTMGKLYNFIRYKMKDIETGEIDYDHMRELALKHKPKILLAGFSGYPRELDYAKFAAIGNEAGAMLMADMAHIAGLIAAGVLDNPFNHGFHVMTSTTHKTLRGPRGGIILSNGTVSNPLKAPEHTLENLPTLIDRSVFPGFQGGPHMAQVLAKAVAFGEAAQPEFKVYAKQVLVNAQRLADQLMAKGFRLITNGTDNHLMQVDMKSSLDIDGREAQEVLDRIHLTANCNAIPDDPLPPFRPSGVRLGTPALTTRGMKAADMDRIAEWIHQALTHRSDDSYITKLAAEVRDYCKQFPLPSDRQTKG
ncbi:MAG TPA: serine hydroxymethyltransferase [Candidatus Saccharimonadales bacterium]|nr:serine hydroxymethyltransferase [Candidatus Saccharimonadales bacterium]